MSRYRCRNFQMAKKLLKAEKKSKKNTVEKKKAKYEPQWKFVIGQEPTQFY